MPKSRVLWTANPAVKFALTPDTVAAATPAPDEVTAETTPAASTVSAEDEAKRAAYEARIVHESYETLRATLLSEQSKNEQQRVQTENAIEETNLKIKETQSALYELEHSPAPAPSLAPKQAAPQSNAQPVNPPLWPEPTPISQPLAQMQLVHPKQPTPKMAASAAQHPTAMQGTAQQWDTQQSVAQQSVAAAQVRDAHTTNVSPIAPSTMVLWGQELPLRQDGDIYVMPDGSITYLGNMLSYFQRLGLKVVYYSPGFSYQPQDIILLPFAPNPLPSQFTLVLNNNKRRTWEFLKWAFAQRGITL